MLAVPIKAECLVPKVKVSPADFLEYDTCFLRHPKTRPIEIINEDSLQARYEIVPQDEQSKRIAVYTADKEGGIIPPKSSQIVNIALRTEMLNTVRIPLYVKVEGHAVPSMLTVLATSMGPLVEADREELDYGSVEVLKDYTERLTIKNKSKIPAEYTAFTKQKESIWKVIQRHGVLQPDDEREIEVVCNADEVQKFQDTLHIIINNGVDLEVALRAKGTGSTLYCKAPLTTVDFGTEYTHQPVTKEFFLENRGRKQMKILW
jgi:hydrocephalus-inducing protein